MQLHLPFWDKDKPKQNERPSFLLFFVKARRTHSSRERKSMGQEKVFNILAGLGLSRNDIRLKKLQRKNLVTVKSERVALYLAIPFEKALDSFTKLRIKEVTQMQFDRKALLGQPNQK
jgi:uncharacterized protein YpbB